MQRRRGDCVEDRANSDSETYDRLALSGRYFAHKFGRNAVCRYIVQIRAPIYVPTVSPFRRIPRRVSPFRSGIPSSPPPPTPCFGPLRASYTCIRSYRSSRAPPLDYSETSKKLMLVDKQKEGEREREREIILYYREYAYIYSDEEIFSRHLRIALIVEIKSSYRSLPFR